MTRHPQLLTIKLQAPPHRDELVPRSRLLDRLDEGARRKLTLLSAPAGFGKTTAVSEWLAARPRAAAWLALDPADRDPARFLTYLVSALRTLEPGLGEAVLTALASPQPPPTEWLVTEILNDLATLRGDTVLVLDDYHLVDARPIDETLTDLLDRLPPKLHLVVTTREDPDLRLAGRRARGEMIELRARDLRFTSAEAAAFLAGPMGLKLAPQQVEALEARTEGWVAGLQLAALSLQGREDAAEFVRDFAGDHRYIVDFLTEEVLQRQPESVRRFLLDTSVLERLSGPLCDAVTGGPGSEAMLHDLERRNLFVVPLDDRRLWYRYHPLFADALGGRLRRERPEDVHVLHQRASAWHESDGSAAEAVRHALDGEDFERAARLIESAWRSMDGSFQSATWLAWARSLPEELIGSRPVLGAGYGWALLNEGDLEAAERHLLEVQRWLDGARAPAGRRAAGAPSSRGGTAVDDETLRSLPATVASARAYHALASGDPTAGVAHACHALELLPATDHAARGVPLGTLALAHWANGDLDEAHRLLSDAMAGFRAVGQEAAAISGSFALADIRLVQGRLRDAERTYQEALEFATGTSEPPLPGMAELHVGLAEVRWAQGELQDAETHLRRAEALGERAVLPGDEARLRRAMARLEAGLGRPDRAHDLLDEAQRLRIRNPMPELRPPAAVRARVWIAEGRLAEAQAWLRERALPSTDEPTFVGEYEHVVAARLLLALHRRDRSRSPLDDAADLLARLLAAAERGGRTGSAIEILVLQALAREAQGDRPAALASLGRALAAAEPEGHVRVFLDEGRPMQVLLREAAAGTTPGYARRLAGAFGPGSTPPPGAWLEALTEREAEVLRYLETDLTGPEIARELRVSLNTMRTHVKNLYSKLGVNQRRSAVRRARDLGML